MTVRSREDLKQSLLSRAFEQGRQQEVYEEIQRRIARSNITPEHRGILDYFNLINEDQPRAIQGLNTEAYYKGEPVIFDGSIKEEIPEEDKIAFIPPEPK